MSVNWAAHYADLIRLRRCTYCRKFLADDVTERECPDCKIKRTEYEQARYQSRVESRQCSRCAASLAAGYPWKTCSTCLEYVRGREKLRHHQKTGKARKSQPAKFRTARRVLDNESPRWAALDAEMAIECERCGLRGPHECLPLHVEPWDRRGPGRALPEPGGCGFTPAEKRRMGAVASKFIRFTNAKRDAMRAGR